jgi:hypothetical protein
MAIDLNASIKLTEWLYKGSIPLQLSNLKLYYIMKLSSLTIDELNTLQNNALIECNFELADIIEIELNSRF